MSATVGALLVDQAFDRVALGDRLRDCRFALDDLLSFVLLWGTVALALRAWIPVLIALGGALALARLGRLDLAVRGRHEAAPE